MTPRQALLALQITHGDRLSDMLGVSDRTIERWLSEGPSKRGAEAIGAVASRQRSMSYRIAASMVENLRGGDLRRAYRSADARDDLRDSLRDALSIIRKPIQKAPAKREPVRLTKRERILAEAIRIGEWYDQRHPYRIPPFKVILDMQSMNRREFGRSPDAIANRIARLAKDIHAMLDEGVFGVRKFGEAYFAFMTLVSDEVMMYDLIEFETDRWVALIASCLKRLSEYFERRGYDELSIAIKKVRAQIIAISKDMSYEDVLVVEIDEGYPLRTP